MKKVNKGDYGYIRYEKKKRLLITVALFLIPLAAFLAAFLITGTKKNIITVIAMVGCLPACRVILQITIIFLLLISCSGYPSYVLKLVVPDQQQIFV